MALGYAWFDSYDSVGYVLTLHIFPPYSLASLTAFANSAALQVVN